MSATSPVPPSKFARIFFWPVYFFVERVRYARSLLLLLLLVPDFYVAFSLFQVTTASVTFNASESRGIAYIDPVRALLTDVQHLRVAVTLPGGPSDTDLEVMRTSGEQHAKEVQVQHEKHGEFLDRGGVWAKAKDLWKTVATADKSDLKTMSTALDALSPLLANDLIVGQAGNYSNLILDPDLDSYWMMDSYIIKLPLLGELSATLGANSITAVEGTEAAKVKLTIEQRLALAGTVGLINSNAGDLVAVDLKAALDDNEIYNAAENRMGNKRLRGVLEGPFHATSKELLAFTQLINDKLLVPELPAITPKELAAEASKVISRVQDLEAKISPELDLLCIQRTDRYRDTRLAGILVFLVAALLISYVFNGFTSSVRKQQAVIVDEHRLLQGDILGLLQVVSRAADGDLTARAKVGDGTLGNVADAFNQMMESWQTLVGQIMKQLDRTNHAVAELRASAGTMAGGASQQAMEVVAATSSVQKMSEEIGRVSGNAENAAAAAQRTQVSAQQGSDSVQNVVVGMESLRSLVQAGAKKIKALGDRSMEINSIVGTITKISEQTNMLALNAAIEAARAGEQGRGFSVVADEVRKLAERTATATQEIEKLVRNIQVETTESVQAIERQTQVVEEEGRVVAEAGHALTRIQDTSSQSSTLVSDIAGIARTQVQGAQIVVGTMQRISTIAQETEGRAQNSLTIAQELGELSTELRASMGHFKVG